MHKDAPSFEDFIQSHQFTFFVGQEGKPIIVHAAAVAAASQQLDALINGGMKESETRCARIEDVRVDDFIRFCEYAYRGDYTVPQWEKSQPEPSSTSFESQQVRDDDDWGDFTSSIPKKNKKKARKVRVTSPEPDSGLAPVDEPASAGMYYPTESLAYDGPEPEVKSVSRTSLRTQFNSRNYVNDGGPKALILKHFEPKSNNAADQNFTPVLLAHARLYCFAHLRLIAPLKALTLQKLHKTLMDFKLYTKRIEDIIELLRYAYSNSDLPGRNDDGTLDDLRNLVVEYVVCEIDTIGKCDKFVKYMEEGGEFVGDFWRMARDYMA